MYLYIPMPALVTILSAQYPQQAYIIKAHLESEGIECFIKDELTVQTNPLYSNAIGGIKLQVKEEDIPEATKILRSEGYLTERESNENPYEEIKWLADKIPFFKNVRFEVRLIIMVVIVVAVTYLLIYFLTKQ